MGNRTILGLLVAVTAAVLAATAAGSSTGAANPAWIVVSAHPNGGRDLQLFRLLATGGEIHQVTTGSLPAISPGFAPDGKRLVFSRLGSGLFVVNLDGSGLRRLTSNNRDSYPAWAPDGKRIAFVRPYKQQWRVFMVSPTGGKARLVPKAPPAGRPSWSPDSKSLLIPSAGDLITVDSTTGKIKKYAGLQLDTQVSQTAAVSPDARRIAYVGPRVPTGPEDCGEAMCPQYGLYLANIGAPHRARRIVNDAGAPGWSPDSQLLVFAGKGPLVILNATTLKTTASIDTSPHIVAGDAPPVWQPR